MGVRKRRSSVCGGAPTLIRVPHRSAGKGQASDDLILPIQFEPSDRAKTPGRGHTSGGER
jgi:hypothetical protein